MKQLLTVLSVLMLCTNLSAQNKSAFVKLSVKEALELAKKQDKSVLIECTDNSRMKKDQAEKINKEVYSSGETGKLIADNFICIRVDGMNDAQFAEFQPYSVGSTYPCVMMLYWTGIKIGYYPEPSAVQTDKAGFMEALKGAVAKSNVKRNNTRHIIFQNISFEEARKKAKAENKLIFIDAMFEGCHWCKEMEINTYTLNVVADFYNKNFICLQIDFLKETKMKDAYPSDGYPTYFYIDADGKLLFQEAGFTPDGEKFNGYGKTAMAKKK